MARKDDVTIQLPGVPRRPGRPSTGKALDNAARSKAKRDRLEADGKKQVSVTISIDVLEAIKRHVQFKDLTLGDAFDKALRDRFLRKR